MTISPSILAEEASELIEYMISDARNLAHGYIRLGRFDLAREPIKSLDFGISLCTNIHLDNQTEIPKPLVSDIQRAQQQYVHEEINAALESRGYYGN